jgi:hypothetical protein
MTVVKISVSFGASFFLSLSLATAGKLKAKAKMKNEK